MDTAHEATDHIISVTESKLQALYAQEDGKREQMVYDFLVKFQAEDDELTRQYKNGEITKSTYENKRRKLLMGSKDYKKLVKKLTASYADTNRQALEIINGQRAEVFVINYNYVGKDIENQVRRMLNGK